MNDVLGTNEPEQEVANPGTGNDDGKLKEIIARELAQSEGYKGLQRAYNKQMEAFNRERAEWKSQLESLKASQGGIAEGVNYLSEKFMQALPEEDRAAIVTELERKRLMDMEKQLAELRRAAMQPAAAPLPGDDDLEEQFKQLEQEALDSLRETATEHGIDPSDKRLDYGQPGTKFAQRLKTLNKSIREVRAAKDEAEIDSVRQKVPTPPTRTSGGVAVTPSNGGSLLELGADELWKQLQAGQVGARRKRGN